MKISSKLNELKPIDLNCNVFDVYSYDGLTIQELLCQFFTKINECINISNETIDLASWLVNEGLKIEVVEKLMLWLNDGTLENLINVNLFNTLHTKIENIENKMSLDPDMFEGSDIEKLQQAVDYVINNNYEEIILHRIYNITGGSIYINKSGEFPRKPIYIKSLNGGIEKHDNGFVFTSNNKNVGELFISDMKITSTQGVGAKVYDVSKLIRINSNNNYYSNIDYVFYDDSDYAQSIRSGYDYFTFIKCVCKIRYGYDIHFNNCLCEESYKFFEDDEIEKHYINNNISITDCVIENIKDLAIKMNGCQSLNISNNYFELNNGYIKLGQYGASGCNISANFFYDTGDLKPCIEIEGGDNKKYTLSSNYVSGTLELVRCNNNSIKFLDLANHISDGAILSSNLKIVKSFDEYSNLQGNKGVKVNSGVKQFTYKIDYFEVGANEEVEKIIENTDNIKLDDLISVTQNNLGNSVIVYPVKVRDDGITVKVKNIGSERNGCHLYVNVIKLNNTNLY